MAIQDVYQAVMQFNSAGMAQLVQKELDGGCAVTELLNQGLIAAMDEVGRRFSAGELFVPEMLMAAQTMKMGLQVIKPLLGSGEQAGAGTVVIGTVKGDLHDIGKNLVAMMMEGAGFTVVDLGVDVDADTFAAAVAEHGAQILALSALLTTTMPAMKATLETVREQGLAVKVIVGGAPVTQDFADSIGADGYGQDAPAAVELARKLIA